MDFETVPVMVPDYVDPAGDCIDGEEEGTCDELGILWVGETMEGLFGPEPTE